MKISQASTDNAKVASTVRGAAPWIAGVLAVFTASSALPQGNIDAGKSPAQMFADTCSNCHRRPSELKRGASASFLRQHYTPGSQEAAAMASYLAGIPADTRGKERERAKEKTKAQQAQERPQDRPKGAQQAQQQSKGKRAELAKAAAEPPPEAPAETRVEAVAVPKLEPFEE